ncbi:hypothetical protein B0H21DRAFT_820890 [Amylocystis lapponica]|nr:hypothetical protein B0H21DRAFT_820890 [Amylocystis lapponica]
MSFVLFFEDVLHEKKLSKCNNCYISQTEKPLHKCARCKAAKYCSKECQKADWKKHKGICANNAALADALRKHDSTPLGALERLMLPDGVSFYEFDQRLEQWVRFHTATLMGAAMQR